MQRKSTSWILSTLGVLALAVPAMDCIVQPAPAVQPLRPGPATGPPGQPGPDEAVAEPDAEPAQPLVFAVYGDTPSVAWSPSGRYLAVTHAHDYLGETDPAQGGIAVIDTQSGTSEFWVQGQGYHPVWLDEQTVAFGCSPYECDEQRAGIYLVQRGGAPRRVLARGVYHTRLAGPDQVLFWAGWPQEDGWLVWSRRDGSLRKVPGTPGVDFGASWFPPSDRLVDQCPASVGGVSIQSDAGGVFLVDARTGEQERIAVAVPWQIRTDVVEDGVIRPCLSPDGRHAVYFASGDEGNEIGIVPLR